ncbi:MAG: GspE/PulE family protein [Planctomycetota bacterium]
MKLPFVSKKRQDFSEPDKDLQRNLDPGAAESQACSESQPVRGLSDLYSPEEADESHVYDIADVLLDMGKIDPKQHKRLRQKQRAKPAFDAATLLLKEGLIDAHDILTAKAKLYGLEFRHIEPPDVEKEAFEKLDIDFIQSSSVCPIAIEEDTLVVATDEPANVFAVEDVKKQTQMDVRVIVCSAKDIEAVCNAFKAEPIDHDLDDIMSDMTDVEVIQDEKEDAEDLEKMAGQSPVIKFVNYLISNAIREGASDIHIEPKKKSTRIRYRIDGVLFETMQPSLKMHPAIVSRIKIMANLDISQRRLPQDGKISVIVGGKAIDLRVSTLPTSYGEKVVIRVLDSRSILRGLGKLGMEPDVMDAFREQIAFPHGILLVTGPTGSGKTTTLYSALCQMDGDKLNISTVEDPVEYQLDFCSQVQTNEKIELDFASALRSLLRQDPDIIMIGEIRDNETAHIAVQAALTGHLVLSTLHTNDAASSITRLADIGIETYLIAASLNAVLAQRLVRKICPKCKEIYTMPENMRKHIVKAGVRTKNFYHGAGCDSCRGSGYVGRVGIYELLVIDDLFRDVINADSSISNMRQVFRKSGQKSLFDDGIIKVKQGLTTIEEVIRVTEIYGQSEE